MLAFLKTRPLSAHFRAATLNGAGARLPLAIIALLLIASGCEQSKPAEKAPKATAKTVAPASKSMPKAAHASPRKPRAPRPADLITWNTPTGLTKIKPKNSFRRESYEVPPGKGEKTLGILNVFAFGGDVDSNVTRWKGQFDGLDAKTVKRTDREVSGLKQTILEVPKGKYSGGMAPEEGGENYGMLAALIPVRPAGAKADVLYIFKLTGPSGGVEAAKPAFMKMLDSVKPAPAHKGSHSADSKAAGSGKSNEKVKSKH